MGSQRERNKRKYQQMEDSCDKIMALCAEMIELWNYNNVDVNILMAIVNGTELNVDLGNYREYLISTILVLQTAIEMQKFIHDIKTMI